MRISAKGRYAIAASISLAQNYDAGEYITVMSISEKLNISKIYLEQVFSLLKRGGIVNSVKGAQGGYQLARMPEQITLYDILTAVELSLFETNEDTVLQSAQDIEAAMRALVYERLDEMLKKTLTSVTLNELTAEAEKNKHQDGLMYYI
jgi:Rrf2 family cysteine metabolism transcriptional repressor